MDPEATPRPYDITILYMQDALEWCEYLFDLFSPYDVSQNSENITEFPTQEGTIQAIKSSFVRIAILSPAFLERCSSELERLIADKPVVGLLCGVSKTDLGVLELRLPSHKSWTLADAQEDPKSLTQTTMRVLDEAWKEETESLYLPMAGNLPPAEDPDELDELYVSGTVTSPESNLYDLTDTYDILTVVPARILCNSQKKFYILFPTNSLREENAYLVRVSGSESSTHVEGTAVNPYVLCVCPPKDMLPGSVTMEITSDGSIIGNCSATIVSHLDELVEHLKSSMEPMTVMCESLGISPASINQLDNILYEHVNSIQNSNMLKDALTSSQEGKLTKSDKLYPTALHFAASFGLKNITNYLLGLPGADHAGMVKNRDSLNPAQMAKKNGHDQLADIMHYPVHPGDGKSGGYVTMVPGSKTDYDRPRLQDHQAMDLIDEGGSIYKLYFPENSQFHRHDDEDEPERYEPIQVNPLPGPALPSRMNPTSPLPSPQSAADEGVDTSADDDWQKELWDIDQRILNKEITTTEAHKRFEHWRLKHMDKVTAAGPSLRNAPPSRPNMMPSRQVSEAMREQRTQSTISRPILATSHSVPQTTSTPYLRACSVGNDPSSADILQSDIAKSSGKPPSGPRGSNISASLQLDMAPSRPPPPIPSSSPLEGFPDRPPPPPPSADKQKQMKPPVAIRPDSQAPPAPPARQTRHPPVPAPRH